MKVIIILANILSMQLYASQENYNLSTIDIDGVYQAQKISPADQVKKMRRQLEARNEEMLKKRMETIRLQQELELMKKIENAFNQSMNNLDQVQ